LGFDLWGGDPLFNKIKIEYVPKLNADTDQPMYFIDLNTLYPVILKGDNFVRTKPQAVSEMHRVRAVFVDATFNFFCKDRRRQACIQEAD